MITKQRFPPRVFFATWVFGAVAVLAALPDTAAADPTIRELLGNRGASAELLRTPRAHPYLFFSADDIPRLRAIAKRAPYRACAEGIVRTARLTLENPIPAEPAAGAADSRIADGSYDESFLKSNYDFLSYAYAMEYYGPLFAFAHLLTGEQEFAERAKAWALAYAGWTNWGPAADPWDMEAAMILSGVVIVYDWIPEQFSDTERERLLEGLRDKGQRLCEKDARWLTYDPAERRGGLANNHRWRSIPLEGLAGLGLLYELDEARDWLDMGLVLTRDYLLPAAYGRDGERMEGRGWLGVCLSDGGRFMEALARNGGPNLFDHQPLRRLSHFLLYGTDMYLTRGQHSERAGLLIHASRLHDPKLQWLALQYNLNPEQQGYPAYWYNRNKVLYQPETRHLLALRWVATAGRMEIEVDGAVCDRQDVTRGRGVDRVMFYADGDELEIATCEVLDHSGAVVTRLDGPALLNGADRDAALAFPSLARGELRISLRKMHSDRGAAGVNLMSAGRIVRGVRFTEDHEITKVLSNMAGSCTLGVTAANGLYFHGPWEFLFHDESLEPAAPATDRTAFLFRDLGLVKLHDTLDPHGIHVAFTSGPEVSKEQGDKNAFTLRAFGEDLTAPLQAPSTGEATLTQAQYDLTAWYRGTPGRNTILVDGRGQPTVHEDSPVPREYDRQWLGGEEVPKSGRIEEAFFTPTYDYVRGDAARAYRPLLQTYQRQLMFLKPARNPKQRWLVLFDDIEMAQGQQCEVEWRLLTSCPSVESADGVSWIRGRAAGLCVTHAWPDDAPVIIDRTPAPREADRRPFLRFPTPAPASRRGQYLHVLQPVRLPSDGQLQPVQRVLGDNGIGVRLRTGGAQTVAYFRTGGRMMNVNGLRTDARACLVEHRDDGPDALALHDATFAEREKELLLRSSEAISLWMTMGQSVCITARSPAACEATFAGPPSADIVLRVDGDVVPNSAFERLSEQQVRLRLKAGDQEISVAPVNVSPVLR